MTLGVLMTACSQEESYDTSYGGKRVLWLGTSIPAGCTYPKKACEALGLKCTNRAVGASFICIHPSEEPLYDHTGNSLSMTKREKEELYKPIEQEGKISRQRYEMWLDCSFEELVMKDIKQIDIVVFDHGFNDRLTLEYEAGEAAVDWTSEDRTTYVGAFNYLYRRIKEANPDVLVMVGGYWQTECSAEPRGKRVAALDTWIAHHYDLPLLDVWARVGVKDGYVPNSAQYIDSINERYQTFYHKINPDAEGNITYYQQFCPDGVHPFSDPTGRSDTVLDSVFTVLLRERLIDAFGAYCTSEQR